MPKLYIVATPIGNLKDISFRALETLKKVDLILCEDTRVAKKLLDCYEISKQTISYHQHSKLKKSKYILEQLRGGKDLALISDAGTPLISDPGAKLIKYLLEQLSNLKIIPVPGPSALICALSISGISADKFVFLGFPPAKKKRKKFFKEVADSKYTIVFYESCHRILKTLQELSFVIASKARQSQKLPIDKNASLRFSRNNERQVIVYRELTKKFETVYRGEVKEIIEQIQNPPAGGKVKGEFVVVVEGL
ncbi:MAG: 16S rRNA (cytidine(1402)-2'-O)-methyltransferase [Patescibacteria group bacterium]|nr:16S rRNA (cytidine(1402)-2'-O)-methyltransferase [Patescibacteria group bacterium]